MQFNTGWEKIDGVRRFRHGVAFSLEPSQALPSIDPLLPKVSRFNEFVRAYPYELARFRMWHFAGNVRSGIYGVSEIPPELVKPKVFIFLGYLSQTSEPDYELVLNDFDVLLPLYKFLVQRHGAAAVGTEIPSGVGTQLDVVLKTGDTFSFYEIKTAQSARACVREALS
ncbi:MAG: hypothetical protein NT158_03440 [Cyanobacteria bacterium]|nr:hypothetical protein [Cyanobacteriota bacterium]